MKTSKKLLSILLAVLLLASCMVTAFAASGTEGDLTWNYNETTKTLTISGTGDMPDYDSSDPAWYTYNSDTDSTDYLFEIKNLVIENGVTSIGDWAFYECSALTSVTIPSSVTSIGIGAFEKCTALKSVTIPDSVTNIGSQAFNECSALTSVTIPSSVTIIDHSTFAFCTALTSVTIPDSVTSIDDSAFLSCTALKSVTIPSSVTSIGANAFYNCSALTSVTIPDSVTSFGKWAFHSCSALTEVNYTGSEEQWSNIRNIKNAFPNGVTINYNYVAAPQNVTVTVIADEGGTVSGGGTYTYGEPVTVTATPNPGYRFDLWYESGARLSGDPSYTFEACDIELRATFLWVGNDETDPGTTDPGTPENACPWCGQVHEGFFQGIIGFFHRIFAAIFGAKY